MGWDAMRGEGAFWTTLFLYAARQDTISEEARDRHGRPDMTDMTGRQTDIQTRSIHAHVCFVRGRASERLPQRPQRSPLQNARVFSALCAFN